MQSSTMFEFKFKLCHIPYFVTFTYFKNHKNEISFKIQSYINYLGKMLNKLPTCHTFCFRFQ